MVGSEVDNSEIIILGRGWVLSDGGTVFGVETSWPVGRGRERCFLV